MVKCSSCGNTVFVPSPFHWKQKEALKKLDLARLLVAAISKVYPGAVFTDIFHHPDNCIIHFHALGGEGSDSVCILSDGSWYQIMSGDLNLNDLEKLKDLLKPLCKTYHASRVAQRIMWGMRNLFE